MKAMSQLSIILLFIIVYVPLNAVRGQVADFPDFSSIEKYSESNVSKLITKSYIHPDWFESCGKEYFCYVLTDSLGKQFYRVDPQQGDKELLFDNGRLAAKLREVSGGNYNPLNLGISSPLRFDKKDPELITFNIGREYFLYDRRSESISPVDKSDEKQRIFQYLRGSEPSWKSFCADSTYYLYSNGHDLYLKRRNDIDSLRLTWDGESEFSYAGGRTPPQTGNYPPSGRWLKDSHYFYTLRTDRRQVQQMPIVNNLASPIPTVETYKFPTPGTADVFRYDLLVVDADKKRAIKVDIGKYPDQKVEIPLFANGNGYADSRYVYFLRKSRPADTLELCRVDAKTGKLSVLISENTAPHYNEQMFRYYFTDNRDIIWWSERSGKGAYYLYGQKGGLKNAITPPGRMVAGDIVYMDTLRRNVIVEGYGGEEGVNPYYKFYYKVNLDGSGFTMLTPGNGDHNISISPGGNYILDTYSRVDTVESRVVRDMTGREILRLESPDPTAAFASGWKMPEVRKIKAADGITDLYGIVYLPFALEPDRKYPIITNVYPGPQDDQMPQKFVIDDNGNQTLAQLGFVVINFVYRGSGPKRGRDFYTYGYGNIRDFALADDRAAIRQIAEAYPFADTTRVGIYGHSGGGFMTAAAMLITKTYFLFYL